MRNSRSVPMATCPFKLTRQPPFLSSATERETKIVQVATAYNVAPDPPGCFAAITAIIQDFVRYPMR